MISHHTSYQAHCYFNISIREYVDCSVHRLHTYFLSGQKLISSFYPDIPFSDILLLFFLIRKLY